MVFWSHQARGCNRVSAEIGWNWDEDDEGIQTVFSWPEIPHFGDFQIWGSLDLFKVFPNSKPPNTNDPKIQPLRLLQSSEVLEECCLKTGWLSLWLHFDDTVILDESF